VAFTRLDAELLESTASNRKFLLINNLDIIFAGNYLHTGQDALSINFNPGRRRQLLKSALSCKKVNT
jgi:hypothetical protein